MFSNPDTLFTLPCEMVPGTLVTPDSHSFVRNNILICFYLLLWNNFAKDFTDIHVHNKILSITCIYESDESHRNGNHRNAVCVTSGD